MGKIWKNQASCNYPIMNLLKYDTRVWRFDGRCYITPSFLVQLQYGAVMCYFTHLFLALIINKIIQPLGGLSEQ